MRKRSDKARILQNTKRNGFRVLGVSAILATITVFMAVNFSVMVDPSSAQVAECTTGGSITGTVFNDYNNNGVQDAGEPGIPGVEVSGYLSSTTGTASAGTACETISTAGSEGQYSFEPASFPVRMEFTLPDSLQDYLKPGPAGGTTVQFVNAASGGIDVAFHDPADFCEANFEFSTTCFAYGVSTNITTPQDAVVSIDYNTPGVIITATGSRVDAAPHTVEAQTADVGSVLGLAYSGKDERLFASAWVKRHVDLGPEGAGAIYTIDRNTNTPQLYFDINSLPGAPAGAVTNRPDAVPTSGWPSAISPAKHLFFDVDAYLKVGTTGIGDIDLSPDDKTLFAVNMNDKQLYIMPADSATIPVAASDVTTVAIPNTCANAADARPMALGYNNGKMYVGSVCSAESIVDALPLTNPTVTNDITFTYSAEFDALFGNTFYAEVFEYDIATSTFNPAPVVTVDLTYQRGCIFRLGMSATPSTPASCADVNATTNWRPWQSDWTQVFNDTYSSGNTANDGAGNPVEYPQPILSDIEFDGEDMILGLRDLNGDRTGHAAGAPSTAIPAPGFAPTQTFRGAGLGDTLRACSTGAGFSLENNGACGVATTVGADNNEGPGGGEYYWNDQTPGGPNNTASNSFPVDFDAGHEESGLGMLMQVAGQPQVVVPSVDVTEFYDAGFIYFNNTTGASDKRVKLYDSVVDFNNGSVDADPEGDGLLAGKGNGIGDLEAICQAAPIQIGNLLWIDSNSNGVQDPGEIGAAGVVIELFKSPDLTTPIATATTDANGNYYFSSAVGTDTASAIYSIGDLLPEMDYVIRVAQNQAGTPIETLFPTLTNSSTGLNGDIRDSDAISTTAGSTVVLEVPVTTGVIGENDHSFDIGFSPIEVQEMFRDWGDLPDTYATSANLNGPNHILVDGLRMGACVDGETDGGPSALAVGDDENQPTSTAGGSGTCDPTGDDEDGILFRTFTPQTDAGFASGVAVCTAIDVFVTAFVPTTATADGVLNAWADLDADGSFSSAEQFVTNNAVNGALVNSTTPLNFPAPQAGATEPLGTVQAVIGLQIPCDQTLVGQNIGFRFRYTSGSGVGGDAPFGQANNGEVEDYILPVFGWDFGDSPENVDPSDPFTYETTIPTVLNGNYKNSTDPATAAGGARHIVIPGGVRLGSSVETELDGQVSGGDSDTNTGGDGSNEEDGWGISESTILTSRWDNGQDGFLRVNVSQVDPDLGACVYGFIDWEGNGFAQGVTSTGVQHVTADGEATIVFPATIERDSFFDGAGDNRGAYVRLRVIDGTGNPTDCAAVTASPDNDFVLLPGNASGYACSGEVEDYFLNFTPTAVTLQDFVAVQASTNQAILLIVLFTLLAATGVALVGYRRSRES